MADKITPRWKVGDRVYHRDYGQGTVTQIDRGNNSFYYLVSFPRELGEGNALRWFPIYEHFDAA